MKLLATIIVITLMSFSISAQIIDDVEIPNEINVITIMAYAKTGSIKKYVFECFYGQEHKAAAKPMTIKLSNGNVIKPEYTQTVMNYFYNNGWELISSVMIKHNNSSRIEYILRRIKD